MPNLKRLKTFFNLLKDEHLMQQIEKMPLNKSSSASENWGKTRSLLEGQTEKLPSGTRNIEISDRDKLVADVLNADLNLASATRQNIPGALAKKFEAEQDLRGYDHWRMVDSKSTDPNYDKNSREVLENIAKRKSKK